MTVRMPRDMYDRTAKQAGREGVSVAAVIRHALADYLREQRRKVEAREGTL